MLLTAQAIIAEIGSGKLVIEPFDPDCLKPASYVVKLGARFRRWKRGNRPVRLWSADAAVDRLEDAIEPEILTLAPGDFALGSIAEAIALPEDLYATLSPLSHVARFGLNIHCGADFISPGFGSTQKTMLTLELANLNVISLQLTPGMPVAHLRFGRVEGRGGARALSKSVYEGTDPLVEPRLHREWVGLIGPLDGETTNGAEG